MGIAKRMKQAKRGEQGALENLQRRRHASLMHFRNLQRGHILHCKRHQFFKSDAENNTSVNKHMKSEIIGNVGLVMRNHTVGHILCCNCGIPTIPNAANMCLKCMPLENSHITHDLPHHARLVCCPTCKAYLHPPKTWVKFQTESDLLAFCVKRLKRSSTISYVDAKFLFTEPHSKRMKLQLKVQKEVCEGLYAHKSHIVDFIVLDQKCPTCMPVVDPNNIHWEAVVQVRQHVSHMRTFYYLEQFIIKHQAAVRSVKIDPVPQGVDFYFSKKSYAASFFAFLSKVVPVKKQNFHERLISQDTKSNLSRYKHNIAATICPICHEDLIFLAPKRYRNLGMHGPLVICTKVRNTITLLDPFTLQERTLSSGLYWKAPFKSLLSSRQLIEYIVLDVEVDSSRSHDNRQDKYVLAEVHIARVSDFGKNDTIYTVKTHLGHLLKPGDMALGYDICGANISDSEADKCQSSMPDVLLIKKKPEKKKFLKKSKCMDMEADSTHGQHERNLSEYEQFLRDLEANPESRFRMSLDAENFDTSLPSTIDEDTISFSDLQDIFADLDLSDGTGNGSFTE